MGDEDAVRVTKVVSFMDMSSPAAGLIEERAHTTKKARLAGSSDPKDLVGGIFDVSNMDNFGRRVMEAVSKECTFDFMRLVPGLRRVTKRATIVCTWDSIGSDYAQVDPDTGMLYLSKRLRPGGDTRRMFKSIVGYAIGEIAHFVDAYVLTDKQRTEIYKAFNTGKDDADVTVDDWFKGGYWDRVGEAFMNAFTLAYCTITPDQAHFKYKATPAVGRLVKRIIG